MSFPRKSGLTGLVAGVLALGLATTALAQGAPGQPGHENERPSMGREGGHGGGRHASRQLDILDTDSNGSASQEEISGELGRLLGAADVDGDGQLSPDEIERRTKLLYNQRARPAPA